MASPRAPSSFWSAYERRFLFPVAGVFAAGVVLWLLVVVGSLAFNPGTPSWICRAGLFCDAEAVVRIQVSSFSLRTGISPFAWLGLAYFLVLAAAIAVPTLRRSAD